MPPKEGTYFDYDSRAQEATPPNFVCLGCGEELGTRWTDYHGEGVCLNCELPYQLLHYEKDTEGNNKRVDGPPTLNVKEALVPFIKRYYAETRQGCGLGTYMGGYPDIAERRHAFGKWLKAQPGTEEFFKRPEP